MTCLNVHVSKKYFGNEWGSEFAKTITSKREIADKAVQKVKKKYGEVVRRTVVIDKDNQLKGLKELYAKYAS